MQQEQFQTVDEQILVAHILDGMEPEPLVTLMAEVFSQDILASRQTLGQWFVLLHRLVVAGV
jgi:hypothetical protein